MTRVASVAETKRNSYNHHSKVPQEGGTLRRMYDLARSGAWFNKTDFPEITPVYFSANMEKLRNYYGQSFERKAVPWNQEEKANGHLSGTKYFEYRLLGEYEGADFVPLERIYTGLDNESKTKSN